VRSRSPRASGAPTWCATWSRPESTLQANHLREVLKVADSHAVADPHELPTGISKLYAKTM